MTQNEFCVYVFKDEQIVQILIYHNLFDALDNCDFFNSEEMQNAGFYACYRVKFRKENYYATL